MKIWLLFIVFHIWAAECLWSERLWASGTRASSGSGVESEAILPPPKSGTAVGIMFGDPTGLTVKHWLGNAGALQFGLAYALNDSLALLGDYLWQFKWKWQLTPYLGVGGELQAGSNVNFAVRIPLGIEFLPRKLPIGVFAELAPALVLAPATQGEIQGDLGIRVYF